MIRERILLLGLVVGGLSGCAMPVASREDVAADAPLHPTDPGLLSTAQVAAINAAVTRPGYAGSYRDEDLVYLAFDRTGIAAAADLAGPSVRLVEVRHSLVEMEATKARIVALVAGNRGYGSLGIDIDKRRNGVAVGSVILATGGASACPTPLPLPARDPVNGVPIFDNRTC